jgi:predicted nucleic acid-binding protein
VTLYVVDASVVAKWYFPEDDCEAAARLLNPVKELIAPDLLHAEFANTLWKRLRAGAIVMDEANEMVADFVRQPVSLRPAAPLIPMALDIGLRAGRTAYDSLYAALAVAEKCRLVTADRPLYNALLPERSENLLWVADVPAL